MVTVTVYPITGPQFGPIRIPHRFCEECNLTIGLVRRLIAESGREDIEVVIKPWLRHAVDALRRGGWHAPVVTIDGKVYSQGVVPEPEELRRRLTGERAPMNRSLLGPTSELEGTPRLCATRRTSREL
jgi:hypothetical protein